MTSETYTLNGPTEFYFPHPVREPSQLTVEVVPGGVVPPTSYSVIGYGPDATGVTVRYDDAPDDGTTELKITRYVAPERITVFADSGTIMPTTLDVELDNLLLAVKDGRVSDFRGEWAAGESYVTPDIVKAPDGSLYYCAEAHVAGTDFAADLAAGKWVLALDLAEAQAGVDTAVAAADDAEQSALAAASSASTAESAEAGAILAKNAAQTALEEFQGTWYGPLSSDPSTDPNGAAPTEGDVYYNTTEGEVRVYDGAEWVPLATGGGAISFDSVSASFDSVSAMEQATDLSVGLVVRTLGYYAPHDGGGAVYRIVASGTGTADGGSFINLTGSGVQAQALFVGRVNVRQFGARGDNTGDDKAAIQAAIDYAGGSKEVYIPGGVYRIGSPIYLDTDNSTVRGAGRRTTMLLSTGTASPVVNITSQYCTLSDLSLDYSGTPTDGASTIKVLGDNATVDNYIIYRGWVGVQLGDGTMKSCGAFRSRNFLIYNYEQVGVFFWGAIDCFMAQGELNAGSSTRGAMGGFRLVDFNEAIIVRDVDVLVGKYSITSDSASYTEASRPAYCYFTNVFFDSSDEGSVIQNWVESTFTGCWWSGGRSGSGYDGLRIEQCEGLNFLGCQWFNCGCNGVQVNAQCDQIGFVGCSFESNGVLDSLASGCYLQPGCSGVRVVGCKASNNLYADGDQAYGLFVADGSSDFVVTGCDFRGNRYSNGLVLGSSLSNGRVRDNLGISRQSGQIYSGSSSPYTYTAGPRSEVVYISGGTIGTIYHNGVPVFTDENHTLVLGPHDTIQINFSGTIYINRVVLG